MAVRLSWWCRYYVSDHCCVRVSNEESVLMPVSTNPQLGFAVHCFDFLSCTRGAGTHDVVIVTAGFQNSQMASKASTMGSHICNHKER